MKHLSNYDFFLVYHGSNRYFDKFSSSELGSNMGKTPSNMTGFFFTDNKNVAKSFGKYLYTCEIILKNPRIINANFKNYADFKFKLNDICEKTDKNIYDGIIIKNYVDSFHTNPIASTQYIVFDSINIKIKNIT